MIASSSIDPTETTAPPSLTEGEQVVAVLLSLFGIALVLGAFIWLGISTRGGHLAAKEAVTTTQVAGRGVTTTSTDYAETLVIATMTVGAALLLCGVFFGRIRSISIGGTGISLDARKDMAKKGAAAVIQAKETAEERAPADKQAEAGQLALALAIPAVVGLASWGIRSLSPETIGEAVGIEAANEVQEDRPTTR